jgi:hypothetical protein
VGRHRRPRAARDRRRLEGSRAAARAYAALVCLRLFVIAFAIQALFCISPDGRRSRFVARADRAALAKKLLVLTLSLIETILHAIDRARTALIAGGIITRALRGATCATAGCWCRPCGSPWW